MRTLSVRLLTLIAVTSILSFLSRRYDSLFSYTISIVPDNYRYCCNLSTVTYVRNEHMNMSIANEWSNYWSGSKKFHTKDTKVVRINVSPIDSYLNRDVSICSSETFLIMMFPVRTNAFAIRQLLRKAIPQGIILQGKKVNRVFVIALADNDREGHKRIREEKYQYGDIIISRHKDSYINVPLSVWDGYIWIRDHCSSAVFGGKFDPDDVILLGNLVAILQQYPKQRFLGGKCNGVSIFQARNINKTVNKYSIPYDYPDRIPYKFCCGAAMLLSKDSLDYLVAGAHYEPYFNCADDIMTGLILTRVGIQPIIMGTEHCVFEINTVQCSRRYSNISLLPPCIVSYNTVKSVDEYNKSLIYFGDRLYSDNLQGKVNLDVKIKPKRCY